MKLLLAPFRDLLDAHPAACIATALFVALSFLLVAGLSVYDRREPRL